MDLKWMQMWYTDITLLRCQDWQSTPWCFGEFIFLCISIFSFVSVAAGEGRTLGWTSIWSCWRQDRIFLDAFWTVKLPALPPYCRPVVQRGCKLKWVTTIIPCWYLRMIISRGSLESCALNCLIMYVVLPKLQLLKRLLLLIMNNTSPFLNASKNNNDSSDEKARLQYA